MGRQTPTVATGPENKFDFDRAVREAIAEFIRRGESFSAWNVTQSINHKHPNGQVRHAPVRAATHSLMKQFVDSRRYDPITTEAGKNLGYIKYVPVRK